MTSAFDKIVIVTKETQMDQLVRAFATKSQAKFYLAQAAQAAAPVNAQSTQKKAGSAKNIQAHQVKSEFDEISLADSAYKEALKNLQSAIPAGIKVQHIDWSYLPTFLFGEKDLVIALGQDGLVINIAKYLSEQPIVAVNPDPARYDGVLLPFTVGDFNHHFRRIVSGEFGVSAITIAKASLNDGQTIHGVNDIFIGPRTHTSFRCNVSFMGREEYQSSSGIIVSTGCGSTGWFRSIVEGARRISSGFDNAKPAKEQSRFPWDANHLFFSVREPFESKTSKTDITFGKITTGDPLVVTSLMGRNGIIFSDGTESDFIEFNSGKIATITLSDRKAKLIKK
ncbi:MAG TPA: sugar kinase [Spirochaetota bacterium]|nr:sugar kinase [Spirochaetota bacterium]HNT09703.1 sugar kinase [Spirochaetota bacterium]